MVRGPLAPWMVRDGRKDIAGPCETRRGRDATPDALFLSDSLPMRVDTVEMFLANRRATGCSGRTLDVYGWNLRRAEAAMGWPLTARGSVEIERYLASLHGRMKPVSVHQVFRTLRTFFTWSVQAGLIQESPMRGLTMKSPKTLPRVPSDDAVRALLAACPNTFEGLRNRAIVALLADSGLRIGEALRLRIADVNFASLTILVRGGKGGKDGVGHFDLDAAHALRRWLMLRRGLAADDYVFADRQGRPLSRKHGTHILHRLSKCAGLDPKIGPHQLRHYAATSILRQTGDLELVRRVLRHESLTMALRYTHLTATDVSAKFRRASPLNNLRAGR